MRSLYDVKSEIYILNSKIIQKGSITECVNGCEPNETRLIGNLELVLVIDPHPFAGVGYSSGRMGDPIRVIGLREVDSSEELSVWREGFAKHPEYGVLCTSAHASGLIPLETYKTMMENIKTGDDLVGLKNMINKYFGVSC